MIIGFTGTIGSGKTTSADYLIMKYGFRKVNFKDALIREVLRNFPELLKEILSYYHFKDNAELLSAYPRPPLVRALLQNYGTNVRRNDKDNYWIDCWIAEIQPNENIVVDDVRFLNEADAVLRLNGGVYRVNGKTPASLQSNHLSETEQVKIIVTANIQNHQSVEDLYKQLDTIIQLEKEKQ